MRERYPRHWSPRPITITIDHAIRERELTREQAAKAIGVPPAELFKIQRGHFRGIDKATLEGMLAAIAAIGKDSK
ncbi:hypothetical protein [Caballeronia sp. dw_19]|uniref:hypothetical protein n=1 Tax=Caballeronia sp. dw_19 TaxID=2719791 RepID=UPI001BD59276|nr:hypothetical protein [Caballeronia sp. dw_19]